MQILWRLLFPDTPETVVFKRFRESAPAALPFSYTVLYEYSATLKKYLHKIKFEHNTKLLTMLAKKILADYHHPRHLDLIIPVPTHPHRARERGFDHTAKLIENFAYFHKIPLRTDIVYREYQTRPLFALSALDRQKEIHASFNIWPTKAAELKGKDILLFDDILTTGNTLKAVYEKLQQCQPKSITVLCLSRPAAKPASLLQPPPSRR